MSSKSPVSVLFDKDGNPVDVYHIRDRYVVAMEDSRALEELQRIRKLLQKTVVHLAAISGLKGNIDDLAKLEE